MKDSDKYQLDICEKDNHEFYSKEENLSLLLYKINDNKNNNFWNE